MEIKVAELHLLRLMNRVHMHMSVYRFQKGGGGGYIFSKPHWGVGGRSIFRFSLPVSQVAVITIQADPDLSLYA